MYVSIIQNNDTKSEISFNTNEFLLSQFKKHK